MFYKDLERLIDEKQRWTKASDQIELCRNKIPRNALQRNAPLAFNARRLPSKPA